MVGCTGCVACVGGDCGSMYIAPEGAAVCCGEPPTAIDAMPYGFLLESSGEALECVEYPYS